MVTRMIEKGENVQYFAEMPPSAKQMLVIEDRC
jgi:hypothetical protein